MFRLQLFTPAARNKLGISARDREEEFHIFTGEPILISSHFLKNVKEKSQRSLNKNADCNPIWLPHVSAVSKSCT